MTRRVSVKSVAILLLLVFVSVLWTSPVPKVSAANTVVDSSTCTGVGLSWNSGTSTCTLTGLYTINSADSLEVPSGTTLLMTGSSSQIVIDGRINIDFGGILTDQGERIVTGGTAGIDNHGTVNMENSGSGIFLNVNGILINEFNGVINIENTGGYGISQNGGTITNTGTINIMNTGGDSIDNLGTLTNEPEGKIIVNCGTPINNLSGSTFNQYGTYTIKTCSDVGVPQFSTSPLGPLLLTIVIGPLLLIMRRRPRIR